jgi:hypothetical protein
LPAAFAAALLASACQHDTSADFDDGTLPSTDQGGSAAAAGTTSDVGAAGAADEGGAAQSGGSGGKPATAGAGGMTGGAGKPAIGGKGGEETGGTGPAGSSGSTATGGTAGSAQAGTAGGGGKPNPVSDPITIDIRTFEDTTIASCDPNEDFSHDPTLQTDGDFCRYEALLKPVLTEIPAGAQIDKATLTLVCVNPGGQVDISFITTNWKISSVHYNTRPKSSEPFDSFTCAGTGDVITLDVTDALKGWLDGKRQAYGLYLTTENTDGTDFGSSEAEPADRPVLSVTYTPPAK